MGKRRGRGNQKADLVIRQQLAAFRKKFGRDPLPHEPVFFDPDEDVPTPLTEEKLMMDFLEAMNLADLPPQIAYAIERTGLVLMEGAEDHYPADAVEDWEAEEGLGHAVVTSADGHNPLRD